MATQVIQEAKVHELVEGLFREDLHAKRVLSMSHVTLGVIHAVSLAVHSIGQGLALARGLEKKHAVKQVDRFLSNTGIEVWELFPAWVGFVVGGRPEVVVAMDWTEFDADGHSTIALNLLTEHGRATPLVWKTVKKTELKKRRNEYEDDALQRLKESLPSTVTKVTVLADRGFGDSKLYEAMKEEWGFHFNIRFRGVVLVTSEEEVTRPASEWVPDNGRPRILRNARVTAEQVPIPAVVLVHAKGMKEPWILAVSDSELSAAEAVKQYGRRFTIEETFRDIKNLRFGMGLSSTRASTPERRDRLFLVSALAISLSTLLGAAGEAVDLERHFKANTSKKRSYSLFRQGCMYYEFLPTMLAAGAEPLVAKFAELLAQHRVLTRIFGPI